MNSINAFYEKKLRDFPDIQGPMFEERKLEEQDSLLGFPNRGNPGLKQDVGDILANF